MDSLNFESEMEADGQGSYSLFPALDSMSSLTGAAESLDAWVCWPEDECVIYEKIPFTLAQTPEKLFNIAAQKYPKRALLLF